MRHEKTATVTVYQFETYDIQSDRMQRSRRWATREAIEMIKVGVILEDTATEIDARALTSNGMTEIGFNPHSQLHRGPQRQVY